MPLLTLSSAIAAFGAEAKAKLSNVAAAGEPEDQLRAPLEGLIDDLSELCGFPRNAVAAVGESTIAAFRSAGGGIAVAAGDVNGDGRAEVIAGATAPLEGPAANLTSSVVFRKPIPVQAFDAGTGALRQQLLPTGLPARGPAGGLPFASVKPDENGVADLLLGATSGTSPVVRVEDWLTGAEVLRLLASPLPTTPGVFVAGS